MKARERSQLQANEEIAAATLGKDMPLSLGKAKQALLKHTVHVYSYVDHVVASVLIEADDSNRPYIMHLTYTGSDLRVDRAFLIDLERKIVVDLTSNWNTDINMKMKIGVIRKDLEI